MAVQNQGLNENARKLLDGVAGKDIGRQFTFDGEVIPLPRYDVSQDLSYWTFVQDQKGNVVYLALHDGRGPVPGSLWPKPIVL